MYYIYIHTRGTTARSCPSRGAVLRSNVAYFSRINIQLSTSPLLQSSHERIGAANEVQQTTQCATLAIFLPAVRTRRVQPVRFG